MDSGSGDARWILGGLWNGLGDRMCGFASVSAGSGYAAWILGELWVGPEVRMCGFANVVLVVDMLDEFLVDSGSDQASFGFTRRRVLDTSG